MKCSAEYEVINIMKTLQSLIYLTNFIFTETSHSYFTCAFLKNSNKFQNVYYDQLGFFPVSHLFVESDSYNSWQCLANVRTHKY